MSNASSEPDFQTAATRWAVTWQLVQDLWPGWEATDDQRRIWERTLGRRNQVQVRETLEQVFAEKASTWPRLGWVLKILKGSTPEQDTAGRYEFSEEEIASVLGEDQDMIDDLTKLPPEYLQELLLEVRRYTKKSDTESPNDVRKWDPMLRGLVWTAWEHRRRRGSEDAQGRRAPGMPRETTFQETDQRGSEGLWSDGSHGGPTM